jgi:ABC-2 type transport system ATP-binding protein
MYEIEIKNFIKKYDRLTAVNDLTLFVSRHELFGLIGPDGAGKTTLMRSVCTLLVPTSGSIMVKGMEVTRNIATIRSLLGYMPQRFSLYLDLSVEQNLRFFADLFQVPPREYEDRLQLLYQFSRLEPFKKRLAGALSGGMKQKLALSCALIHTPEILILDEPTFGVDPVSRQEFWNILRSIQQQGTTILVSTAYMDEANQCDRVALLFNGQLRGLGTPAELRATYQYPLYRLQGSNLPELENYFRRQTQVHITQKFGDALHVSFYQKPDETYWQACRRSTTGNLRQWAVQTPSIEDIFLELMGSANE